MEIFLAFIYCSTFCRLKRGSRQSNKKFSKTSYIHSKNIIVALSEEVRGKKDHDENIRVIFSSQFSLFSTSSFLEQSHAFELNLCENFLLLPPVRTSLYTRRFDSMKSCSIGFIWWNIFALEKWKMRENSPVFFHKGQSENICFSSTNCDDDLLLFCFKSSLMVERRNIFLRCCCCLYYENMNDQKNSQNVMIFHFFIRKFSQEKKTLKTELKATQLDLEYWFRHCKLHAHYLAMTEGLSSN